MAMYTCSKCGGANGKTAKKCKKCGSTKLQPKEATAKKPKSPRLSPKDGVQIDLMDLPELRDGTDVEDTGSATPALDTTDASNFFTGDPGSPLYVEVVIGADKGKRMAVLDGQPLTLGASPNSDMPLAGDAFVSNRHATVTLKEGVLLLSDENSSNGTYVRVRDHQQIQVGDEILLGKTLLRIIQEQ